MKKSLLHGLLATTILAAPEALAADHSHHQGHHCHKGHQHASAPIGVMGDHLHEKGDWMVSYRFNRMTMEGNRNGTNSLSPQEVIQFANPNAPPANLRVVPTEMTMDMHMLGLMYGVTDWLTLMAMGMYVEKEMDHTTFNMAGNEIGTFTTKSDGIGDSALTALIGLFKNKTHNIHLNAGLSLPTGSIDEEDDVLTPMNTRPTLRLPYAMQLGSGTYDALPGITYTGQKAKWSWGAQYKARIPLESENGEGYSWGDKHTLTAWTGYQFTNWFQGTFRLTGETQDEINGRDNQIAAPVQTADPDNYGGKTIEASVGFNITPDHPDWKHHQIGFEIALPVHQDLNGPQMERDTTATLGWTYKF